MSRRKSKGMPAWKVALIIVIAIIVFHFIWGFIPGVLKSGVIIFFFIWFLIHAWRKGWIQKAYTWVKKEFSSNS